MTMKVSHAGSALTAGLCCIDGRTMSLFIPSLFSWTIVGSADYEDTWIKTRGNSQSLWVVQMACEHKYLCKGYIFSNLR